jgi:hypothetical protein
MKNSKITSRTIVRLMSFLLRMYTFLQILHSNFSILSEDPNPILTSTNLVLR